VLGQKGKLFMIILMYLISILIVVLGGVVLFSKKRTDAMIDFWQQENRLYGAGVLRLAIALLLMIGSEAAKQPKVLLCFGLLFALGGILVFAVKLEQSKAMLDWWRGLKRAHQRLWGLASVVIGTAIFFSI
jgi:uncharacterized membrane protein YedE/YeeE